MHSRTSPCEARSLRVASRTAIASALLALCAAAPAANAQSPAELAQKKSCLACHSVDAKKLGPAFKDVAAKYRGVPDAEAKLEAKIRQGGNGNWGKMPMPPQKGLSDGEVKTLATWVLSLT